MTRFFLQKIAFFIFIGLISLSANAADLQAFIQEGDATTPDQKVLVEPSAKAPSTSEGLSAESAQLTHIIELVVAGIVASALIISVLVLFLGRWAGRREKKLIKRIRIKAEEEQEHIIAAATTVREQEKETTKIVHKIRDDVQDFIAKKEEIENFDQDVKEITLQAKAKKEEIDVISNTVNENVDKIKGYWDEQLTSTLSTIAKVQDGLDKGLNQVDKNLDEMLQQKIQSEGLLSEYLSQHNEQINVINKSAVSSEALNQNLKDTLKESNQLLKLLKKHQKSAEKSLNKFTQELSAYEEQAYEQFDTSFQVADLARQELNANIDESRKHIETMRRHEEQSHSINTQTQSNLKKLDFSKIAKLSHTLDSTFSMFTDMSDKVDETRAMLDELNSLEADINKTTASSQVSQQAPQLAKKVEIIKPQAPASIPPKVNLKEPKIELKQKTEVQTKSASKAKPKSSIDANPKVQNKPKVIDKPIADIKPKAPTNVKAKTIAKKVDIKTEKPSVTPLKNTPPKDIITTNKEAPIKPLHVKKAKATPDAKAKPKIEAKSQKVTPEKAAPKKIKSLNIKNKGTAKPLAKPAENSITNVIDERVEIKSLLSSSDASKTAYKMANKMANKDNAPVSFFTNLNKKKPVAKVEKKEPILGSMKRTIFGK